MTLGYSESSSEDVSTAIPLEIDEETAVRADDILREFAEDAGLETALIVDRSGALVSGISAEENVSVEIISALVAGASGAMRALVLRLGETGAIESLHIGGERLVYLKEIVNRFILVAVADGDRPAGMVRQKALAIEPRLDLLLLAVKPKEEEPLILPPAPSRSLREIARERKAMREAEAAAVSGPAGILLEETQAVEVPEEEPIVDEYPAEVGLEESFETLELDPGDDEVSLEEPELEEPELEELELEELELEDPEAEEPQVEAQTEKIAPPPLPEPTEIHEPLEFGEPEIIVEASEHPPFAPPALPVPVDSPFEAEEDEDDELEPEVSKSELDDEETEWYEIEEDSRDLELEEDDDSILPLTEEGGQAEGGSEAVPGAAASLFEFDSEEEEEPLVEGSEDLDTPSAVVLPRPDSLFELAEDDDFEDEEDLAPFEAWDGEEGGNEEDEGDNVFELDDDDFQDEEDGVSDEPDDGDSVDVDEETFEEMIAEEESENEIRNSGPFYF